MKRPRGTDRPLAADRRGELPASRAVFVLERASGAVVGICAIEVAVGLNDPV